MGERRGDDLSTGARVTLQICRVSPQRDQQYDSQEQQYDSALMRRQKWLGDRYDWNADRNHDRDLHEDDQRATWRVGGIDLAFLRFSECTPRQVQPERARTGDDAVDQWDCDESAEQHKKEANPIRREDHHSADDATDPIDLQIDANHQRG